MDFLKVEVETTFLPSQVKMEKSGQGWKLPAPPTLLTPIFRMSFSVSPKRQALL